MDPMMLTLLIISAVIILFAFGIGFYDEWFSSKEENHNIVAFG